MAFLSMGLSGFGGTLPWAHLVLVERRRWLTPVEFTELLSLGQMLPGPNIMNVAIFFGVRCHGIVGGLIAVCGILLMPLVIVLGLATLYAAFGELTVVQRAFHGISPAAAGFIVSFALRMMMSERAGVRVIAVAGLVFAAMVMFQVPLAWLLLAAVPVSIFWTWAERR